MIGSQTPWIEAMLLELGAANITTLEYSPAVSEHPQIRIVSPDKLNEMVSMTEKKKEAFVLPTEPKAGLPHPISPYLRLDCLGLFIVVNVDTALCCIFNFRNHI